MKLINFPGLNCYSNGIVSIVHDLGADYSAAFSALWSETDFYYQPDREVYLSKRLPEALRALGLKFVMQLCDTPGQAEERLSQLEEGELIILGMDAFNVPWSQFYKAFHGPHFFVARYTKGDTFFCYDPTFDKTEVQLSRAGIISHAYDVSRIIRDVKQPSPADPLSDAAEILRVHPDMRRRVLEQMDHCMPAGQETSVRLAKYVDALQNNRYLYRYYLEKLPAPYNQKHLLMNQEFFSKWAAVKIGLYKASIAKKESLFQEINDLFERLIDEEVVIAKQILS